MMDNEELAQQKEDNSEKQAKVELEKYKVEQEKFKKQQEVEKSKQEEYKKDQEESKANQEKLVVKKRELELAMLRTRYKKNKCFIRVLSILLVVFSVILIGGAIWLFCSISKEGSDPTYNWIRLIFGSIMMVSFVILIIVLCLLIKKLLFQSDEG